MSSDSPYLFDMTTGEALKQHGMELAADHRVDELCLARQIAIEIARNGDGTCHMDQVRQRLPEGVELGPAAGSVFKGSEWEFTGLRVRSLLQSNHARELKVWRLIAGNRG